MAPLVVVRVAGDDFSIPIKTRAHEAKLAAHALHVGVGPFARVGSVFDCSVFGREAEGIETHREHHVVAKHSAVASSYIARRHGVPMPGVEVARWIREHREGIPLWPRVVVLGFVYPVGKPPRLPLGFDCARFVAIGHDRTHLSIGEKQFGSFRGSDNAPPTMRRGAA